MQKDVTFNTSLSFSRHIYGSHHQLRLTSPNFGIEKNLSASPLLKNRRKITLCHYFFTLDNELSSLVLSRNFALS